jgi:hypothetical protein
MNRLDAPTRAAVLNCLIEGCSIRSTVRMTGVSKKAEATRELFQDFWLCSHGACLSKSLRLR